MQEDESCALNLLCDLYWKNKNKRNLFVSVVFDVVTGE